MRQILIVANETVGGDALSSAVEQRLKQGECRFHLLVPLPHRTAAASGSGVTGFSPVGTRQPEIPKGVSKSSPDRNLAEQQLALGLDWLRGLGAEADGQVGDADPVHAVVEAVKRRTADEIIVSTLPSAISRWLRQDLPHKIQRKVDVPVTVVTAGASDRARS